MTQPQAVRWGIVGTGDVAEHKGGPALYQANRSALVAVANRTRRKADEFSSRHGNPVVCQTAEELFARDDLDAVYIATPPSSHLELMKLAANAGKHVLLEKPMAATVAECEEICRLAETNDISLVVAFYRRYFPVVEKVKQLLEAGEIGELLSISATTIAPFHLSQDAWRLNPAISGGGFMMDMGTHRFDLFTYLAGRCTKILGVAKSQSWDLPVDDAATVSLEFESGCLGSATFHWNSQVQRDELQVIGSKGAISVDDLSGQGNLKIEKVSQVGSPELSQLQLPAPSPVHLNLVERFVAHILDGAPNPCPGHEALFATRISEEVSRV